ncbi:MAG TPA: orotidine-5'-phosphate decarboxylase [Pyrinomonadaceae bacterium]|nr:orotidine-5'-phosphate decarboxylase [Pyrinomonadaceae bacterium]
MNVTAKDKLIIALDVETAQEARELFAALRDHAGMFKIGSQLFTAAGPGIVREMIASGGRIFLDLKFHDIPHTVAAAGVEATRLGVSIFNVHGCGGSEMMRRTAEAVAEASLREGLARPSIIAVTLLTSANAATLAEAGIQTSPEELVVRLARLADRCGLDGVVASPQEAAAIRAAISRRKFLIVTPGVRPTDSAPDDQKRFLSPAEAMRAGADYLVVGRAILKAPDPISAAQKILQEMDHDSTVNSKP